MNDSPSQSPADEELMALASSTFGTRESRQAFDEFVTRQRTFAVNFAFSYVRSGHVAEDMAQEGFIRLYESLPRYESKAPPRALLATIIRNACLTYLKREKKVVLGEDVQERVEETLAAPEAEPRDDAAPPDAERVMRIVETLSEAQREAVRLRFFHDFTYDEIGAAMDITRNHVGVLLHQAVKRIRQRLGRDPPGGADFAGIRD